MPDEKPVETPESEAPAADAIPQNLSPEDVETLFEPQTEPTDHSMGALEAFDHEGEDAPQPPEDSGMQAVSPILSGEESEQGPPLPPYTATTGAPLFSEDAFKAPGDFDGTPVPPPPDHPGLPPNPNMVHTLVPQAALQHLWQRADTLQKRVYQEIDNINRARALLDQIQAARNYLMAGRDNYEEAERALNEVEYLLEFNQRVHKWSYTVGKKLLIYEICWAFVLGVAMFVVPWLLRQYAPFFNYSDSNAAGLQSVQWLIDGFKSMFWGGLGGVTGALYALWRHVAEKQDFDKQYTMWYLTNPIMGIALGVFVFLVMQAGLISMAGTEAQTVKTAIPTFVLAWLSGFQQNVAYDIVRRLLKVFQIEDDTDDTLALPPQSSSTK